MKIGVNWFELSQFFEKPLIRDKKNGNFVWGTFVCLFSKLVGFLKDCIYKYLDYIFTRRPYGSLLNHTNLH